MPDEPNPPQQTTTGTEPMGNNPEARNPDGSLKDTQAQPKQTQASEPKPEAKTEAKAEAKPEAKAEEEPKAGEKKSDKATGAPEKYDLRPPEGYTYDDKLLEGATSIFRELGITNDGAQKLIDFYNKAVLEAADAPYKQFEDTQSEWKDEVIKDPALGNGTDDLKPEVKAVIGRAVDSLPAEDAKAFREAMVLTGAGNNPAFVKALYNFAQRLGEGTLVKGGGPAQTGQAKPNSGPRSAAAAMYPNLPSAG